MTAAMPPLSIVRQGLRLTTEALATELAGARPGSDTPDWTDLQWRFASAAAAAHGVSALLGLRSTWKHPDWTRFLTDQHAHVEHRHRRIASLLEGIDTAAREAGIALVALKGSALHAIGLYAPGERPMADIDLLVREEHVDTATALLTDLGYVESFVQWKHRVFKPAAGEPVMGLGEHRDTPINIELHTRIQERLPITAVDITVRIYPDAPHPGINPYPTNGALMSHLLLHAAGNICGRSVRLLHLNDISLLATRMVASDWEVLWASGSPWWALPPLRLVSRYYRHAVPLFVLARLERECPRWLRTISRRRTLTQLSCSALWLQALPGIEWARSLHEVGRCVHNRFRPSDENIRERADMVRTQLWLKGQDWVTLSHARRILTRLTRPVPRMDTLYVVRAALQYSAAVTP